MRRGLVLVMVVAGCGGGGNSGSVPQPDCPMASGNICTVAGNGVAGDGMDGMLPRATMLYAPSDLAFAPDGSMVIVDWNNHRIRQVQPDGKLKIVAGAGELAEGLFGDEVSNRLNHPTDVTFDHMGRMVIAAWHNSKVKRLNAETGALEDIAGTGGRGYGGDGGPALSAVLNLPASVLYDPAGNLIVSDQANQRIRVIDVNGMIDTYAGSGMKGYGGDGGPAREAKFSLPVGQMGHPAAHITRSEAGEIFLADTENNRIRRIGPDAMVSTVAGTGEASATGDGMVATAATLDHPVDVALGPDGGLYIADTENNCLRVVRAGVISTLAGTCARQCPNDATLDDPCRCPATDAACLGDGGPADKARLKRPTGIAFDADGNLYVADTLDHRIRVIYR
jgi:DNA-binding beta-propeller fold protein YncE